MIWNSSVVFCSVKGFTLAVSLLLAASYATALEWSAAERSIIRSLSLAALPPLPDSPSNRVSDDERAIAFGKKIFFDPQFSEDGTLSCAACHQPDKYFTDGLARGVGVALTGRNTPTLIGSGWSRWFYWDGRRDSLWSQALVPFEAANEMGSSRLAVVRAVAQDKNYRNAYLALFGTLPKGLLSADLPANAGAWGDKETQDNWHRLPMGLQKQLNTVYANIGKSIAAYERTLWPQATRFDRYAAQLVAGRPTHTLVSRDEAAGLKLFIDAQKTQCLQCHNGPLFTNHGFHNIGTGSFSGSRLDFGRMPGLQSALLDEFNCVGEYSDAPPHACVQLRFLPKSQHIPLQGAYKVPTLRNAGNTAPYFHDGRFEALKAVMEFYNEPPKHNGPHELLPLNLSDEELDQLAAFVRMLSE